MTWENSIITKINAWSSINARLLCTHNYNFIYMIFPGLILSSFSGSPNNITDAGQQMTEPHRVIKYHVICEQIFRRSAVHYQRILYHCHCNFIEWISWQAPPPGRVVQLLYWRPHRFTYMVTVNHAVDFMVHSIKRITTRASSADIRIYYPKTLIENLK